MSFAFFMPILVAALAVSAIFSLFRVLRLPDASTAEKLKRSMSNQAD